MMSLRSLTVLAALILLQLCGCAAMSKPSDPSVNELERRHDERLVEMGLHPVDQRRERRLGRGLRLQGRWECGESVTQMDQRRRSGLRSRPERSTESDDLACRQSRAPPPR